MSDRAVPPQPPGGVDLASHEDGQDEDQGDISLAASDDSPALEVSPISALELGDLRRTTLDDALDEDDAEGAPRFDFGPPVLDTIRLPLDELERLLVLTGAKITTSDGPPDRGRREAPATSISGPGEGHTSKRSTPVPATPRTMRGVEILLGAPIEAFDGASSATAAFDARARHEENQRRSRWTVAAGLAVTALVGVIASGMHPGLFAGHPSAEAAEVAKAAPEDEGSTAAARDDDGAIAAHDRGSRARAAGTSVTAAAVDARAATLSAARSALTRLRAGVIACARETIGVLPETSPPVPSDLTLTKGEGYMSAKGDWSTPVWSCAGFELDAPQRFQIQWQAAREDVEGLGVAWIDDNEDGAPDRALAFRARLVERWQPDVGDVEPVEPTLPIARAPR